MSKIRGQLYSPNSLGDTSSRDFHQLISLCPKRLVHPPYLQARLRSSLIDWLETLDTPRTTTKALPQSESE